MPEPPPAARDLEAIAAAVADAAAELIRSRLDTNAAIGRKSSPTDVVTQTDLDSESLIRARLAEATPGAGFIGEEGGVSAGPRPLEWIIDPLDGTVNFTLGIPVFAVSIAAAVRGEVVAGAVVDVRSGAVYSAARGTGARLDGHAIGVSSCTSLAQAMVLTGFSYSSELRRSQAALLATVLPAVRDIRCFGSAALELCWVASGLVDAYYERDTKLWDYAAGALIAAEAGAEVELPCPENDGLVAASTPAVFGVFRSLIET